MSHGTRDFARRLLAAIRLFNGGAGLHFPELLARRLGMDRDPELNPGALYVIRLFGVRTVLIGGDLWRAESRARSLRQAVLIQGSDTLAADIAAFSGRLPGKIGLTTTVISALNTTLALLASRGL